MDQTKQKAGTLFWVIAVLATIWNSMGVVSYLQQVYMDEADMAALPEAQRQMMEATPAWVTSAFAFAVFAGFLGSILLLLRKKAAASLLGFSLICVLAQMFYSLVMVKAYEVMGMQAIVFPIVLIGISIFLFAYSRKMIAKGVLS